MTTNDDYLNNSIHQFSVPPDAKVEIKTTYKGKPVSKEQFDKDLEIQNALPTVEKVMQEYKELKKRDSDKTSVINVSENGISVDLDVY